MTLRVVLHRDDVAAGDDNRPWPLEFPDDALVGHVVLAYVRERYLPEMTGSSWLVRQMAGERSRDLAVLVTLDHPKEPLVLRLDHGSGGRQRLDDPWWRTDDGGFEFDAAYRPRTGPLSFDNYRRWTDGEIDW